MSYLVYTEYDVGEYVVFSGKVYQIAEIYLTFTPGEFYKDYILRDPQGYEIPYPVEESAIKRLVARK